MRLTALYIPTVLSTLILSLSACGHLGGTVNILDKQQCIDEGSLGGHCNYEYHVDPSDPDKETWDDMRFGWFCMDPSDTTETKKEGEELCSIDGVTCTYPAQQSVQSYVHHHFLFMQGMYRHARESWRKTHGQKPYPLALRRGAGLGEDIDADHPGVAARPVDAAAPDL